MYRRSRYYNIMRPLSYRSDALRALLLRNQIATFDEMKQALGNPVDVTVFRKLKPDRKSTRLNSSHLGISYAVFCLKKENQLRAYRDRDAEHHSHCGHSARTNQNLARMKSAYFKGRFKLIFFLMIGRPPRSTLFPHPTLFR